MSSFGINGPSNKPIIQESQNLGKDGGGGGNTGYMKMRGKKKKGEEESEDESILLDDTEEDVFEKESDKDEKKGNFFGLIEKLVKKNGKNSNFDDDIFEHNKKETQDKNEDIF